MGSRLFKIFTLLLIASIIGWFAYEEYLKQQVREAAKDFGYELSESELKEWVQRNKVYNRVDRFDEDIKVFIQEDKNSRPPEGAFLFIGSSSIRLWKNLAQDMAPLPTINRGFGGAHTKHINRHKEEIVFKYKPKAIIFFCGSNDINGLSSPKKVFNEFVKFYESVEQALPETKVFAISIQPSPNRFNQRSRQIKWNDLVESHAEENDNLYYVDVSEPMLSEDNKPMPIFYTSDKLHMNEKGYELWTGILRKVLQENYPEDFKN